MAQKYECIAFNHLGCLPIIATSEHLWRDGKEWILCYFWDYTFAYIERNQIILRLKSSSYEFPDSQLSTKELFDRFVD